MQATFYLDFEKRTDSTKVPTGIGTNVTVVLKEGSDIDNPVFQVSNKNILKCNYMAWDGNYYFITGRRYIHKEFFEITCTIDALGSYRSKIMSSSQYVLRSTVSPDYNIIDTAYPSKSNPTVYSQTLTDFGANNTGHYVLLTISGGGIKPYAMSQTEFDSFLSSIYAENIDHWYDAVPQLTGSLVRSFLNVTDYIVGCKWIPFNKATGIGTGPVQLGYWASNVNCTIYKATTPIKTNSVPFTLHPTSGATKAFMNTSAYHSVQIYVPGCGAYPIDYAKFKGANSGTVNYSVDILGNITGDIQNSNGDVLTLISGSLGQDVPVSSKSMSVASFAGMASGAGSVASGIAGLITGIEGAGAELAMGAGEMASGAMASIPDVVTKGTVGSYYYDLTHLTVDVLEVVYDIPAQAPTQQGYPCMKTMTLGTAGFYMIKNPQVDFGDDLYIKSQIESYMAKGFYVE